MNKVINVVILIFLSSCVYSQRTVGLLSYKPWKSFDGYNLIYPHNQSTTYLIDNCGEIVNSWAGAEDDRPGNVAYLLPSGELVRSSRKANITDDPIWAGGGSETLEMLSWENEVLWTYSINTEKERIHHDFRVLPDGHILAIVWELKTEEEAEAAGRDVSTLADGEMWPDKLIEIDPESNEIVWEWHVWDHLVQDQYPSKNNFGVVSEEIGKVNINYDGNEGSADWLHTNALDYDPINEQIIMSVPTFNEVWVIDHTTTTEQAATSSGGFSGKGGELLYRWGNPLAYGQGDASDQTLFYQHDIQFVDDFLKPSHPYYGKFAAFNNRSGADYSTVVIWDNPYDMYEAKFAKLGEVYAPETYVVSKGHPEQTKLFSTGLSSVQVLPNSNLLICDGRHGYSFEMTPDDEIVWEYVTPMKGGVPVDQGFETEVNDNLTFRNKRYPVDFEAFEGKDMSGKGFIELGGEEEFCDQILPVEMTYDNDAMKIYPNPANTFITIEWETKLYEQIEILDIFGRVVYSETISGGRTYLDVSDFDSGYYFARTSGIGVQKFVIAR